MFIAVRDADGKNVTSRMIGGCEKCIMARYPELKATLERVDTEPAKAAK